MKFLHLVIIIPAGLLRFLSEGSSLLQLSSPVELSAKDKRNLYYYEKYTSLNL